MAIPTERSGGSPTVRPLLKMRRSGLLRAKRTNGEPHYALNAITMPFSYGVASEGGREAGSKRASGRLQGT